MALTCPVEFDVATLRNEIRTMYGRVATAPDAEFHFHRGPAYAASRLGYDHHELAQLPVTVTSSFAGVGNPHAIAPIDVNAAVLDIGCGAGTDLLLAARPIGPQGRAIGIDMTAAMRERAMAGASAAGLTNVEVRDGDATRLPLSDASVDIVISNGVLNLVPDKPAAVREIARVQAAVRRSRTSSSAKSFPRVRFETSISGPVESPALCWKQRPSACSSQLVSLMCACSTDSIASPEQRRSVPPSGTASSASI